MNVASASTCPALPSLSLSDLENFDTHAQRGGVERICRCPVCQSSERAFHFNTETGVYNCKRGSCGATGKLTDFWRDRPKLNRTQRTRTALNAAFGLRPTQTTPKPKDAPQTTITTPQASEQADTTTARTTFDWRGCYERAFELDTAKGKPGRKYLQGRGIRIIAAQSAGVRFTPFYPGTGAAVLFPIYDFAGELCAISARAIEGSETRAGGKKSAGVFRCAGALDKSLPALIICEAPMDALSLASCGYPALALIGCSAPEWLHRLTAFRRALLATDADEAGDKASQVLAASLAAYGARCERLRPDGAKDWNEMLHRTARGGLPQWLFVNAWPTPVSTCDAQRVQPDAERVEIANEIGGILQVLAGAKRLKNGDWRINGERYDHDNAVLLAAQTRGTTTNGYPLSFDAGAAYRAAIDESEAEEAAAELTQNDATST